VITVGENTSIYENNNILKSLFYAETEMNGELLFSYSDILYDKDVVGKLMNSCGDISIVVDIDWVSHYEGRDQHPVTEAELVAVEGSRVVRIWELCPSLSYQSCHPSGFVGPHPAPFLYLHGIPCIITLLVGRR